MSVEPKKAKLSRQSTALRTLFRNPDHADDCRNAVEWLYEICHMGEGGFRSDPLLMAKLCGRREVYVEIMKACNLSNDDIERMMTGRDPELTGAQRPAYDAIRGGES